MVLVNFFFFSVLYAFESTKMRWASKSSGFSINYAITESLLMTLFSNLNYADRGDRDSLPTVSTGIAGRPSRPG